MDGDLRAIAIASETAAGCTSCTSARDASSWSDEARRQGIDVQCKHAPTNLSIRVVT